MDPEPVIKSRYAENPSCDFCRIVLAFVRKYQTARSLRYSDTELSCATTSFNYSSDYETCTTELKVDGNLVLGHIDIRTETPLNHPASRPVPGLIDTDCIKSWLRQAERNIETVPGYHFNERMFSGGFRLIDCAQECIAVLYSPCVYLTLSYVWGKKQPQWLFANTLNIKAMSEAGALSATSNLGSRIPNTIQEAMLLTVRLGHRYLWVDALCIVQNDENEKRHVMDHMDEIYAGALTTILVPCCEHADDVIPGVLTARRNTMNHHLSIAVGAHRLRINGDFHPLFYLNKGTHTTRAWCLQEQVLSKGFLLMGASEASLFTREHFWRESGPISGQNILEYNTGKALGPIEVQSILVPVDGEDTLNCYRDLVQDYSRRRCTHSGDVLNAFAGIYNRLCNGAQETLPIGVTQGILPVKLGQALCWYSDFRPREWPALESRRLSTWAWVSWIGAVDYGKSLAKSDQALAASFTFGPKLLSENDGEAEVQGVLSRLLDGVSGNEPFALNIELKFENRNDLAKSPVSLAVGELGFWALCHDLSEYSMRQQYSHRPHYYEIMIDTECDFDVYLDDPAVDGPTELAFLFLYEGLAIRKSTASCQRVGLFRVKPSLHKYWDVTERLAEKLQWKYVVLS